LKKIYRVDSRGSFGKKREFKIFLNPHFQLWLLNKEFSGLESKFKGHIIESYWLHWAKSIYGYYKDFFYLKDSDNKEIDFVSINPSGSPTFKTLHEFKYSDNINTSDLKKILITSSINKVVWCKQTKTKGLIKYISILDIEDN
jgi:predicted AAA+ superfamily ATPase